ncbi:MAG: sulfite exporter TauE/SafE family protein [SAR202 cluster bacterium]|nr:sulfite exporter TauE/SafE family protein [SAR202 cluster bacterium]
MVTGFELFFSILIVAAASTVIGTVGFGFGLVAAPVLLLYLEPQQAVVVLNSLTAIMLAMVLVKNWRQLELRASAGLVLGGIVATPIGVLALNSASPSVLRITIAVVIIFLGLFSLTSVRLPFAERRLAGPTFGFLTSLAVTTIGIGGPLGAIYAIAQRWKPETVRASLALFFFSSDAVAFVLYAATGLVGRDTLANIGVMIPGLIIGFGLASILVNRINDRIFRYAVIAVIVIAGSVMLVREFTGI